MPYNPTPYEAQIGNEIAAELDRWAADFRKRARDWYSTDVFPVTEPPFVTPDSAAAAMGRHVYLLVARELAERASVLALTTERRL